MELRGGTHYLLLKRLTGSTKHQVDCYERFQRALAAWTPGTRISPIFSTDDAPVPRLSKATKQWLILAGPVHPGALRHVPGACVYITHGLLNILIWCKTEQVRKAARSSVAEHSLNGEEWEVKASEIKRITPLRRAHRQVESPASLLRPLYPKDSPLCAAGREYVTLIAECASRATFLTPATGKELVSFDNVMRGGLLNDSVSAMPVLHGHLVNTNAALSRYTSQTYAGIPPLLETECHYWTHSLLGIGIPSLALVRIRRFIQNLLESTKFIERFRRLDKLPPESKPLHCMVPSDEFWSRDLLSSKEVEAGLIANNNDPFVSTLTFFSGRDGFRATHLSLSAPLELIDSCNSVMWTLQTLTHEICHILVDAVLGLALPETSSPTSLRQAVIRMERGVSKNLFEQAQALLCWAVWRLDAGTEPATDDDVTPDMLRELVVKHWGEVTEIITHCLDYLYFYGGDPALFVRSVWLSWSVIPNIEHRVHDYVSRSLCALHTRNMRRKKAREITVDQLIARLQAIHKEFPTVLYVPQAIADLKRRKEYYYSVLDARRPLISFVNSCLYSDALQKQFQYEPRLGGGVHGGYSVQPLRFGGDRVANPLRFIREFSVEGQPNHLRAAWLLQQLALGDAT